MSVIRVREVRLGEEGRGLEYFTSRVSHRTATWQRLALTSSLRLAIWSHSYSIKLAKKKSHLNVILSEPVLWGSGDMSTYEGSRPRPTPPLRWLYGLVSLAPKPKIWIGPNDGPIIC